MTDPAKPDFAAMSQAMYSAIAQANTSWARIENAMAGLLEALLGYSRDYIALHIYFAPNNTETRFKIVDTVARVKWRNYETHKLISEWASIYTAVGRVKETRNRIAHGEIEYPGRLKRGKLTHQARLTASSFDVGRRQKEDKPRQWPGMSVHDVKATADRFYWLALRIEEMREYWKAHSMGQHASLPGIFRRIEGRRRTGGPLVSDPKAQELKAPPRS
jgi:hypothetical protein